MQQTFQKIIQLMQSEKYEEASKTCDEVINSGFSHPQILMMKAIALSKTNEFIKSQNIFNELIKSHTNNPELYYNYALVLQEYKQEQNALMHYDHCLKLNPNHLSALNNSGVIKLNLNQIDEAKFNFEKALSVQPENLEYVRNFANACFHLKQYSICYAKLTKNIQDEFLEEDDYILIIDSLYSEGELIIAELYYKDALKKYPDNAELLNLAGLVDINNKKYRQAKHFFKKAMGKNPEKLEFKLNKLTTNSHLNSKKNTLTKLNKLVNKYSHDISIYEFAANLCETLSAFKKSSNYIKKGLIQDNNNATLLLTKAKILSRKSKYKKAETLLKKALNNTSDTNLKINITYELARANDKGMEFQAAWENILIANRLNQTLLVHNKADNKFVLETSNLMKDFKENFKKTNSINFKEKINLAFIVGFPRSGTTLIEKILQVHHDVKILEETNAINEIKMQIDQFNGLSFFNKLSNLTNQQTLYYRDLYIKNINNYINWQPHNTIVDKMPMNGTHLALINHLFPDAKIIFTVRHPIDVCLSCLMQNMMQVFSFPASVKAYDTYMNIVSTYIQSIDLNIHQVKYENLIDNFETESKKLFKYLNINWTNEVFDFYKNKNIVNTPSYQQVAQPIYKKSKYRYKHYIENFESSVKPLNKWLKHFKYSI